LPHGAGNSNSKGNGAPMQSQIGSADELLYQKIEERDRLEFSLCDSTDVKASIILLLITFLAGLSASLLAAKELDILVRAGQGLVIVLLAASTLFSLLCLKPRDYSTEKRPQEYKKWLSKLREHFAEKPNTESEVLNEFRKGSIDKTLERISQNYDVNRNKLRHLHVSFWFLMAALGSELILLFVQSIKPLF
jgi:hypothetical protein